MSVIDIHETIFDVDNREHGDSAKHLDFMREI